MKSLFRVSAISAMVTFAVAAPARAQLIDFDDLLTRNNFTAQGIQSVYQGYVWGTSLGVAQTSATGWASASTSDRTSLETFAPVSGQGYAWNWNGPQSLFVDFLGLRNFTGGYFARGLGTALDASNANTIQLFGYDATGGLIASSDVLSLTHNFQLLATNFTNIRHLEIRADRASWFAVDNLQVEAPTEVVPEPISMILLGTGMAGLAGVARRRRRQPTSTPRA